MAGSMKSSILSTQGHPPGLGPASMVCACIDIGSNTTRLLVAAPRAGGLRELCQQRAFTRIGRALRDDGRIVTGKIEEVAEVVATQARTAEQLGARALKAVATAAIREAANRDDLVAAVRTRCGVDVEVLTDGEEARLAFVGATATSLRRLVGALLEPETLERGLRVLAGTPVADVARTYELDPERVKLLPAGILMLEEASTRM